MKYLPSEPSYMARRCKIRSQLMQLAVEYRPNDQVVRLNNLAEISSEREVASLSRRDFQRTITITGNLSADSTLTAGTATNLIQDWYRERSEQYPGATIAFGGEAESTAKSMRSLALAFVFGHCINLCHSRGSISQLPSTIHHSV